MERRQRQVTTLCFVLAILPLLGFWTTGLFDLDEGFYAAVAGEMLRRGEWITPYYNGEPWFEKPILLYWLAIPSLAVFGEAIGPRLPSVLCSIGTLFAVFAAVRRYVSLVAAQVSILVLGSSLLAIGVGRMMLSDPPLILALTLALFSTFRSFDTDLDTAQRRSYRLSAGFFLGLAVLAKGPVAVVLFGAILGITAGREPDLRSRMRGGWWPGVAAFAVTVCAWYLPAYQATGQTFIQKFLVEQNLQRFTGGDTAHTLGGPANWFFYFVVLIVGMIPWSFWIPAAWPRRRDGDQPEQLFRRFCGTWALVVVVFFSLSGAKLPHYIAPALPALAILIGIRLARRTTGVPVWPALACVIAALIAGAAFRAYYYGATIGGYRVPGFHSELHALTDWVRRQGGLVAVYQMSRREKDLGTGTLRLRETSHPSILFYLDNNVLDTDELEALLAAPKPLWIITRAGRIRPEDEERIAAAGQILSPAEVDARPEFYRVYRLDGGR